MDDTNPSDEYKTIKGPSIGEFKDRGSKFFAYAYPVYSEEEINFSLEEIKEEHPKSRHVCYAYRLGLDKNHYRANDDGEPSGTAGKPILGQIDSNGLTNVLIAVVRYFGGTKLGVPGLINAYKTGSIEALENAEYITKTVNYLFDLSFDYIHLPKVMSFVKKKEVNVLHQAFEEKGNLRFQVRKTEADAFKLALLATVSGKRIEEVSERETIHGFDCRTTQI